MDPSVVIFGCDSHVANLRFSSRECPLGQISIVINDCLSYDGISSEFFECVEGLMDRLESGELIAGDGRDSIMRCETVLASTTFRKRMLARHLLRVTN